MYIYTIYAQFLSSHFPFSGARQPHLPSVESVCNTSRSILQHPVCKGKVHALYTSGFPKLVNWCIAATFWRPT